MAVNIFDRTVKALARRYPQPFVKVALGSTVLTHQKSFSTLATKDFGVSFMR